MTFVTTQKSQLRIAFKFSYRTGFYAKQESILFYSDVIYDVSNNKSRKFQYFERCSVIKYHTTETPTTETHSLPDPCICPNLFSKKKKRKEKKGKGKGKEK